jgi:hypothetical protein
MRTATRSRRPGVTIRRTPPSAHERSPGVLGDPVDGRHVTLSDSAGTAHRGGSGLAPAGRDRPPGRGHLDSAGIMRGEAPCCSLGLVMRGRS